MRIISGIIFFPAEDGIRGAQESRGLGDVYKRQFQNCSFFTEDVHIAKYQLF